MIAIVTAVRLSSGRRGRPDRPRPRYPARGHLVRVRPLAGSWAAPWHGDPDVGRTPEV